jgi:undecaprenyl-diphosphatase
MPTPAEKQQAQPVKHALKEAVEKVDSPEKADEVIEHLESETAGQTATEVEQQQPNKGSPAEAAQKVQEAARTAADGQKPARVLEETARAVTTQDARQREAVSQAAQEVLNPEQQGAAPTAVSPRQRAYLRQAVLKRLKPWDAVDANLFIIVNHLPHTRVLNTLFYGLTMAYMGGAAWYLTMGLAALRDHSEARTILREVAIPMAVSSSIVEFPIKSYFKRRRPFITIIQAIVIGKKPGSWSFPSGHSAAAFAGAYLLGKKYPRWSPLTYMAAGLVAFSRMYLGDHYPGDVLSGSLSGVLIAMMFNWVARRIGGGAKE